MKKLLILRYSITIFIGLMVIGMSEIIYNYIFNYDIFLKLIEDDVFGKYSFYLFLLLFVIFISALFYTQKMLGLFYKNLYFDSKGINCMKKAGILFITFSLLMIFKSILKTKSLTSIQLFDYLLNFVFLIIGFGMLTFIGILKKGKNLKQENELTV